MAHPYALPQLDPWRVLIAVSEPLLAALYLKTVNSVTGMRRVGVAHRGEDALAFVQRNPCDLVILDLQIAGMNGHQLLQTLRSQRLNVDVIVLANKRDPLTVRTMTHFGVIDYLLLPVTSDRLRQSLGLFKERATALEDEFLSQEAIDRACTFGVLSERQLPDGLTRDRVVLAREVLESESLPLSSVDIGQRMGVSRVTARRYLEYLVTRDLASVEFDREGPGRPRKLYRSATI